MNGSIRMLRWQRGVSLSGLVFVLAILGFLAVIAAKIVPTYSEYRAINSSLQQIKGAGSVREIQLAFDRNASVNYIDTITGKDLVITKDNGETEISFAYEKKIPLAGPVSLLIDYAGSTAPGGAPAKKADEPEK